MNLTRTDFDDRIELTAGNPQYAMIWLHGLGAGADDFVPVFAWLSQQLGIRMKGIFPQAPDRAVTINGGMSMPCWYDIVAARPERVINGEHLLRSAARVQQLADGLIREGIAADRIVIAGFSQGGAVALQSALTFRQPLAGLICLSTYLAQPLALAHENSGLPVFFAHGRHDGVVPMALGSRSVEALNALGLKPEWHEFAMDHEVIAEEMAAIGQFLSQVFA
ncbi:alpha/beta hydrolase [Thalassolituus sp. LLYu03]|uniref:alpha/beta hydrolase n=1 Tax=Thalassolituus sp. LLYu03 TaxID=3421656 RepID=UPI003D2DB906